MSVYQFCRLPSVQMLANWLSCCQVEVREGLLVHAGVEEPLVVFLDEVSVRGLADFELQSQLVKGVVLVFEEESLIVADR